MSSVGKLIPSAASFSLEIAPALANINFDFSLYKEQAPKEFEGVGSALSQLRREEAENGLPHITARKLGALFERVLPSTPGLTRAYGERASEISRAASSTLQSRSNYGVFSSRVGADATSIWAAATSGKSGIAVHLLACLLARIWEGSEATAIWVQMIQCRKEEIIANFEKNNSVEMAILAAAKQDLPRTQLADWDASARAWLRAADGVKNKQQTQLMLIIDNIRAPVNWKIDTYQSVMSAWTNSMAQMEDLVQGFPQKAQGGDILLALSAWHLFPDMALVVPCVKYVRQDDPIFTSGGVLTIGLEPPRPEQKGVYWSLPLAHLRHYGAPVQSERSMNSGERSRISLEEFLQAVLGCFLQGWGEAGANTPDAINWLASIYDLLHNAVSSGSEGARLLVHGHAEFSWLNLLLSAAKHHLNRSGNERLTASKLVSLGRKHGKDFLGLPDKPVFGLLHRGAFVGLVEGEEEKILFLRKIATAIMDKIGPGKHRMFIRYKRHYIGCPQSVFEYASATPWVRETLKRKFHLREGPGGSVEGNIRWLYAGGDLHNRTEDNSYLKRLDQQYGGLNGVEVQRPDLVPADFSKVDPTQRHTLPVQHAFAQSRQFGSVPADFEYWHWSRGHIGPFADSDRCYLSDAQKSLIRADYDARKFHFESRGESIFKRENYMIEDFSPANMGVFWDHSEFCDSHQVPWYKMIYGDLESAALFVTEGREGLIDLHRTGDQDAADLFSLSKTNRMNTHALVDKLHSTFQRANVEADPHLKSLKAVSTAASLYRKFPQATVDIHVLQQKLYDASWVKSSSVLNPRDTSITDYRHPDALEPYMLDRKSSFACITMFESGRYDIRPEDLEDVMAMSSGDSLFIGDALLKDPFENAGGTVQHVAGNIGRAGIAFLVPPVDLMIKKSSMGEWTQLNRNEFDDERKNCFESTSLHLSFTGANTPLNVGFTGGQDSEVYILETLISVHEYARWVADLNPLEISQSDKLRTLPPCIESTCKEGARTSQIMCIENWTELIDTPEEQVCLVQAHKNWQARLAATSLSIQIGFDTLVLPQKVCWSCFDTKIKRLLGSTTNKVKKVILIG